MFFKKRHLPEFDGGILLPVLGLMLIGLVAIYSATSIGDSPAAQVKFTKQLLWSLIGLSLMLVTTVAPLRFFQKHAYFLYVTTLVLLLASLFIGGGAGTRRWIALGPISIQPAELAKVGTLLALARYLSAPNRNLRSLREVLFAFAPAAIPFLLVLKQPDLGSALVFPAMVLPMMLWAGLSPIILFVLLAPIISLICAFNFYSFFGAVLALSLALFLSRRGIVFFLSNFIANIGVGIVTPIIWNSLKEYQRNRILTFLGMVQDPHGLGYQVIQSKVAIGSGGFWGKGFLHGTQTHLRFLPEQHTDFIFCVIGEEFGFIGGLLVIALFAYLVFRGFRLAAVVKSRFSSLLLLGGSIMFMFQMFVNMGMTIGIMPVTGLPLPFLSYGGSSLLSNLLVVGLFLSAARRRFEYI